MVNNTNAHWDRLKAKSLGAQFSHEVIGSLNCSPFGAEAIVEKAHEVYAPIWLHQIKRDLLQVRRAVWPMREVVSTLQRESQEYMSAVIRVYLRDLYDHLVQIIDVLETYHEMATSLTDTYMSMSAVSNCMNEIMRVLTIMSTIFIPLTFLAGGLRHELSAHP